MPEYVYVVSPRSDNRVAFYEADDAHPNGEAFVYSDVKPTKVAKTSAVQSALDRRQLVESSEGAYREHLENAEMARVAAREKDAAFANFPSAGQQVWDTYAESMPDEKRQEAKRLADEKANEAQRREEQQAQEQQQAVEKRKQTIREDQSKTDPSLHSRKD